jgi:DNA-binding transcriptional regulator YiaG
MQNLAALLKQEIARVARKEVRAEIQALKKASAGYRHAIAGLKQHVQALERQVKRQTKGTQSADQGNNAGDERQLRFSAKRLAAQRARLGLSQANFAKLVGVSALSIYNWESGRARPRQPQLKAIADVRTLGKREAAARLEELASRPTRAKRKA